MKPEIVFLEIAKKDLEAAKCLYNEKLFPHAIFYVEQSVEKAIKSFGLWRKVIDEGEAKDVSHEPIKIYFKMAESSKLAMLHAKSRIKMLPRKYGVIGEHEMDTLISQLDEFKRQFPDNKSLLSVSRSRPKLDNALALIRALKDVIVGQFAEKGAELASSTTDTSKFEKYKRSVFEKLKDSPEFTIKASEEQKRFVDEIITPQFVAVYGRALEVLELTQYCYYSLLVLCGIFAPHVSRSRYPFRDINPSDVYTSGLPLIDALLDFIELTMHSLMSLDRLYRKASSVS